MATGKWRLGGAGSPEEGGHRAQGHWGGLRGGDEGLLRGHQEGSGGLVHGRLQRQGDRTLCFICVSVQPGTLKQSQSCLERLLAGTDWKSIRVLTHMFVVVITSFHE